MNILIKVLSCRFYFWYLNEKFQDFSEADDGEFCKIKKFKIKGL